MLTFDYRNNVLYNYQSTGYGSPNDYLRLNYVGSTLKPGPDTPNRSQAAFGEETLYGQWYGEGNDLPPGYTLFEVDERVVVKTPHPWAPVTTHTAEESFRLVVREGGVTKPVKDLITTFVSHSVETGTGRIPDNPASWPEGGFPVYPVVASWVDMNRNGIPDEWEIRQGVDPDSFRANGRELSEEYDNIEVYINSL